MARSRINLKFFKLFLILLISLPTNSFAGIFDPPASDLSVQYLGMIFGGSVGGISLGTLGDNNPFLGNLFQVFNGVILAIAAFILSYVGTVSIIHTAHQGEVMGKKWSSIWIPLRSASGLLLLAPVPGSGYSLLQVTVMWIILNGVGAADKIWNLAVDNLSQGISTAQKADLEEGKVNQFTQYAATLGPQILKSMVCLKVLESCADIPKVQIQNIVIGVHNKDIDYKSGKVIFGIDRTNKPETDTNKYVPLCGQIDLMAEVTANDLPSTDQISENQLKAMSTEAYQTKKQAINSMITYIKPVANEIVSSTIEKVLKENQDVTLSNTDNLDRGILYPAIAIYKNLFSNLTKQSALVKLGMGDTIQTNNINSIVKDNAEKAKKLGWMSAGSFYFMLNKGARQEFLATAFNQLTVTGTPDMANSILAANFKKSEITSELKDIWKKYDDTLKNSSSKINELFADPNLSLAVKRIKFFDPLSNPALIGLTVILPPVGGLIMGMQSIVEYFINRITTISGDPLLEHAQMGYEIMMSTELLFIVLATGSVAISLLMGTCTAVSPGQTSMFTAVMTLVIPAMAIMASLWVLGATLSIYTPMVPYMMYAITSLGWLMLVIEAIVACAIVALGLITPGQEELSQIVPALGILAGIFLKPTLMVVGLIMSSKVFNIMAKFIGFGFAETIALLLNETHQGSMFSCLPITILYVGFIVALENKCFALIYQLPDKVLRWIGISPGETDMSALQETKGAYEANAAKSIQPLQGTTSGALSGAQDKMKALSEKSKQDAEAATKLNETDKNASSSGNAGSGNPGGGNAGSGGSNAGGGAPAATPPASKAGPTGLE